MNKKRQDQEELTLYWTESFPRAIPISKTGMLRVGFTLSEGWEWQNSMPLCEILIQFKSDIV